MHDSFEQALAPGPEEARRARLRRKARVARVIVAMLAVIALALAVTPTVLQWNSARDASHTVATVTDKAHQESKERLAAQRRAAEQYNARLAQSGQPMLSDAASTLPGSGQSGDSPADSDEEYQELLDTLNGIMGAVIIPDIDVELPVRHGTSDTVLASGAGHLYGTSLPVGGTGTHSVITAHRGLVQAEMFTRLDELRKGDWFSIEVLGETLDYRIDRISVIEPDDSSQLRIEPDEDRVTLMTCTPYGVNTQRLLVSGVRATRPVSSPAVDSPGTPLDATHVALLTAAGVLLVALPCVLLTRRRHTTRPHRHVAS